MSSFFNKIKNYSFVHLSKVKNRKSNFCSNPELSSTFEDRINTLKQRYNKITTKQHYNNK